MPEKKFHSGATQAGTSLDSERKYCPECQSDNVYLLSRSFNEEKYICYDCGCVFSLDIRTKKVMIELEPLTQEGDSLKAELSILKIAVEPKPKLGRVCFFKLTVKNKGNISANAFPEELYLDGKLYISSSNSLPPGQKTETLVPWTAVEGEHSIKWVVNRTNEATLSFTVIKNLSSILGMMASKALSCITKYSTGSLITFGPTLILILLSVIQTSLGPKIIGFFLSSAIGLAVTIAIFFPTVVILSLLYSSPVTRIGEYIPEVAPPTMRVAFFEKLLWTVIFLSLFFLMGEVPVFGLPTKMRDDFFPVRLISGGSSYSLLHLGIIPIVEGGLLTFILQLFKGTDTFDPENRQKLRSIEKILIVFVSIFLSLISSLGSNLSTLQIMLFIGQVTFGEMLLMLFIDAGAKGWALTGNHTTGFFITCGIAQEFFWKLFSPIPKPSSYNCEMVGRVPDLILAIISKDPRVVSIIISLVSTFLIGIIIIFLLSVRIEIPISHSYLRGDRGKYPIPLIYSSKSLLAMTTSVMTGIAFLSFLVKFTFIPRWVSEIIQSWVTGPGNYFLETLTYSSSGILNFNWLENIGFIASMVLSCSILSFIVALAELDPHSMAFSLASTGFRIPGFRRSTDVIAKFLSKYMWPTAFLCGEILGLLSSVGALLGTVIGVASMIEMFQTVIQLYQIIAQEQITEMYPMLRRIIG